MIKRTTAIVFILLANILLLAHTVVPHHHHHKQVCLVNSHCKNDNKPDQHDTNRNNHSHDCENNSTNCILKDPIIVLTNQWKVDFRFIDKKADLTGHNENYNSQYNTITEFLFPVFLRLISNHFNNSSYSSLVSASLGLRAPPFV